MIGTGEGSLVGLSLRLPPVSPLEYTNLVSGLPGMLLGVPLELWFVSEAFKYWCSSHRLTY